MARIVGIISADENSIQASFMALNDALEYELYRDEFKTAAGV